MALTRPDVYTDRMTKKFGPKWYSTHDGLFEEHMDQSKLLAELGVLTVFSAGTNPIPPAVFPKETIA